MKKKIIIISSIIFILAIAFFAYLFIKNKNVPVAEQPKVLSFLDFLKSKPTTPDDNTIPDNNDNDNPDIPIDNTPAKKLVQISPDPVAGFDFYQKPISGAEPKEEDLYDIKQITPIYQFKKNIPYLTKGGPLGEDIRKLQKTLNLCSVTIIAKTGVGSKGRETNEFKDGTKNAIIILQKMLGVEQTGNLDDATRTAINNPWSCKIPKDIVPPQTQIAALYTKREDGHIYNTFLDKINLEQLSNSTFPTVYESYFYNNGKNVALSYISKDERTTETTIGEIISSSVKPSDVINSIITLDAKNYSNNLFYIFNFGGNASGTLKGVEGKKDILYSSFSDWNAESSKKRVVLTTKPSSEVLGFVFSVDPSTKSFNKIFGGVLGLTTKVSGEGNSLFYSRSKDKKIESGYYDISTNNNSKINFNTLSDKCFINKNETDIYCGVPKEIISAKYPDDWYMGKIKFSDNIIKYNIATETTTTIIDPGTEGQDFDIDMIKVDDNEEYLILRNKNDYTLWYIKLDVTI